MKVVSTKLTNPEWQKVVDECNQRGVSLAEYLRELIRRDSDGKKPEQNVRKNKDSSESEFEQLLEGFKSFTRWDGLEILGDFHNKGCLKFIQTVLI